jgi:hypothetical protein
MDVADGRLQITDCVSFISFDAVSDIQRVGHSSRHTKPAKARWKPPVPLMQAPAALGVGATRKTHCQWESPSCAAYRVALSNPRNSGRWGRLVCAVSRGLFLVHSLSRRGLYQYLHTSRRTRRRRAFTPNPVPPPQTPSAEKSSATDAYKLSGFLLEEPCHRCDPT